MVCDDELEEAELDEAEVDVVFTLVLEDVALVLEAVLDAAVDVGAGVAPEASP